MRNKRLAFGSASLLTLAVALGGCGSSPSADKSVTSTSSAPPSSTSTTATTAPPTTSTTVANSKGPPSGGPVPPRFDPVSFTAISSRQFWLLGEAPCTTSICTSIVRTVDGGAHFVGIPAPVAPLAAGTGATSASGIDTLRFADAEDGYAFATGQAADFWDTHDGGGHWSQPSALGGQDLLGFGTGDGYAFALVASCSNGNCSGLKLERSAVDADNWAPVAVPVSGQVDELATMTVQGADLWFSVTTSSNQANQLLVAGTGGGSSFTTYQSPCSSGLGGSVQASSASVLWAVCPTGMMAQAFRSADGGAHWATLNPGELPNSAVLAPASDTAAVVVPSGQGPVEATSDGGATWHNVSGTSLSGSYGWSWAGFTDAATGTALQTDGALPAGWPWPHGPFPEQLWRTSDGGSTWTGPVKIS